MTWTPPEPARFRSPPTGDRPAALALLLPIMISLGGSGNLAGTHMEAPLLPPGAGSLGVTVSAAPSTGSVPLLVDFTVTTNSTVVLWFDWAFGDGSSLNGSSSTTRSPTHWYAAPGTYDASVEAFDGDATGRANVTIRVLPVALVVSIQTSQTSGPAPLPVTFTAVPRGGSGTYTTFDWRFGDGGTAAGLVVNYTYSREGIYTASVLVVDSAGTTASASTPVNITAAGATPSTGVGPFAGASPWITLALAAPFISGAVALASWEWSRRRETRSGSAAPIDGPPVGRGDAGAGPPSGDTSLPPESEVAGLPAMAEPTSPARLTASTFRSGPRESRSNDPALLGPPPELRRASQRIIVHLGSQEGVRPNDLPGRARTQAGMSEALGIPKNVLSNVLRRLVSAGVLTVETGHVRGADRRMKVYQLTPKGETLARELRYRREAAVSNTYGKGAPRRPALPPVREESNTRP